MIYPDPDREDGVGNDDQGLFPVDPDREEGVDDPDDQGGPATSLNAINGYGEYDEPVVPGEVRTDRFGNVTVGAVAARAVSTVHVQ